jgi:hypothetical protein
MKSLFVCSEKKINDHVGEFYDEIFEVEHQPTTKSVPHVAKEVKGLIRSLWKLDVEDKERTGEPCVFIHLDAASPFNAMLQDFQIVMEKEEQIKIALPYLTERRTGTADREAQSALKKLENRRTE